MVSPHKLKIFITGVAVMKLLSLGGLGLWWIVDIFLLITYNLTPEENWNQYV